MQEIAQLFANNRAWSSGIQQRDPEFFHKLSRQQAPDYLWIGCSDSRVPANEIVGMMPGELFVHRNIANVIVPTDLNCLSVMQYAVDVLKVRHIIVCGHYGCGGVRAVAEDERVGLADNWLHHIRDVREKHAALLATREEAARKLDLLCELNVIEQVANVCHTTVVQDAWRRRHRVIVHGWIYGLWDGQLRDLQLAVAASDEIAPAVERALAALG
jgi:carbonic anhydrase